MPERKTANIPPIGMAIHVHLSGNASYYTLFTADLDLTCTEPPPHVIATLQLAITSTFPIILGKILFVVSFFELWLMDVATGCCYDKQCL
jgi:hypothetical protein